LQVSRENQEPPIISWLVAVGLPKSVIHGVGYVLETNGFDKVHLMVGLLFRAMSTDKFNAD
jgi:hypothetical protein